MKVQVCTFLLCIFSQMYLLYTLDYLKNFQLYNQFTKQAQLHIFSQDIFSKRFNNLKLNIIKYKHHVFTPDLLHPRPIPFLFGSNSILAVAPAKTRKRQPWCHASPSTSNKQILLTRAKIHPNYNSTFTIDLVKVKWSRSVVSSSLWLHGL